MTDTLPRRNNYNPEDPSKFPEIAKELTTEFRKVSEQIKAYP